jgi:oligosaccharide repeat unit polymerase
MAFDWSLCTISLAGALILFIAAIFSFRFEKTFFAPGTAMLTTWGSALFFLAFLPLRGFYHLSIEAVLLYVLGGIWFATIAVLTSLILNKYLKTTTCIDYSTTDNLNYTRILLLWTVISVFVYPLAVINILNYGSNIVEISYTIRRLTVNGERILHPILSNLFVVIGVLSNIVFFGVVQKRVKLEKFIILVLPFVAISLIVSGRSGLVSLILGWMVILGIFSDKMKLRYLIFSFSFLFFVLYFGAIWVKKFEVEGLSSGEILFVFFDHILAYLYQGPVLFSRYLTGEINIATNWDFLNSIHHILSKFNLGHPLPLHQAFASFGTHYSGNVYSIYFSIVPLYGFLGLTIVFLIYASSLAFIFEMFKNRMLFGLLVYPIMFSAILLSVYKDAIGYSTYWVIKVAFIYIFIKIFLTRFDCKNSLQ